MVQIPGYFIFYFEVEDNIRFSAKRENLLERGDTLAHEAAIEPFSGVEFSDLRGGEIADRATSIGGALNRGIVNRNEMRVTGHMQIGLDKSRAEFDGASKSHHRIFWGVAGSSAMRDDPGLSHDRLS